MTTSLAAQLKQLASPATQELLNEKQRKSFLCDRPSDTFDTETCFQIGVSGFDELCTKDRAFEDFGVLFNDLNTVGSPENIRKLLLVLSPYLRLKAAHKALEWLVRRHQVHLNHADHLIQCFLPFHEDEIFRRMLNLLDLKAQQNRKWGWLLNFQKNGTFLARLTLVNHCRADPSFLAIVTDLVQSSVKIFDSDGFKVERLQMVMAFYGLTLMALVQSGPITDGIMTAILPVLCRGLKSHIEDFKRASSAILIEILQRTTIKTHLVETFMNAVCKNLKSTLKESVCVLLQLLQTQKSEKLTKKSFKRLIRCAGLAHLLGTLSTQFNTDRLVLAILQKLIPAAVKDNASGTSSGYSTDDGDDDANPMPMTLLRDIMMHVSMEANTRTMAARWILENFVQHCNNCDVDLNELAEHMKDLVRIFETRYPEALDAAIEGALSKIEDDKDRELIQQFLNVAVSSVHHRLAPNSRTTLALSLHHHKASVRLNAVAYLLDNLDSIDDKEPVKQSFLDRLQDDNKEVVILLLKNPVKLWSVFSDKSELIAGLLAKVRVIDTCFSKLSLVKEVLTVLSQSDATPALEVVALSYLFLPSLHPAALELAVNLLSSHLSASSSLLAHLSKVWLPKLKEVQSKSKNDAAESDLTTLNESLLDCLTEVMISQDTQTVMEKIWAEMEAVPALRQKCLIYICSEVTLKVLVKTTEQETVSRLNQLFSKCIKYCLLDKALWCKKSVQSSDTEVSVLHEVMTCLLKNSSLPAVWWKDLLTRWISSLSVPDQLKEMKFWHAGANDPVTGPWLQAVVMITEVFLHLGRKKRLSETADDLLTGLQKVFGSVDLYLRYLCVLWSGDHSRSLGVTNAVRDSILKLTQTYMEALGEADINYIVHSAVPVVPCLLALCVEDESVRHVALSMLWNIGEKSPSSSALYMPALNLVRHYRQEITADKTYLVTALANLGTKTSKRKSKQTDVLPEMLKVIESSTTPAFIKAALLQALSGTDSMDALTPLLPLLARLLKQDTLIEADIEVVGLLLARYTVTVAPALACKETALGLLTDAIKKQSLAGPQQVAISQISKLFFAALPSLESKRCIAGALLDVLQSTPSVEVAQLIRKVFRKVSLPVDLLSEELSPILHNAASTVREAKRMRREKTETGSTFETATWIRVTVLLEMLQSKKKVSDCNGLVPLLFQVLAKVLEVEDAEEGEYLKQLILGLIQSLCKKSSDKEAIQGKDLNLEAVVQCIRTSSNAITHQHALSVLTVAAHISPEQLLHSMMSVFTFMGASIMRQDDSHSLQVITAVLETIFPALLMACSEHEADRVEDMITMVMRVFVDAYPHIPEHRKLIIFTTLVRVVGGESHLWRFLLVFIEGVAVRPKTSVLNSEGSTSTDQGDKAKAIDQVHVDFLMSLMLRFSPLSCLQMAGQAVSYMSQLAHKNKEVSKQKLSRQTASVLGTTRAECQIFSMTSHTNKQLHRYRHATVGTLQQLLSSKQFIAKISEELTEDVLGALKQLLEVLLSYMAQVCQAAEHVNSPQVAYWKGLQMRCGLLLDNLVSLLPLDQFLVVVTELLDSPLSAVQRKAMELFSSCLKDNRVQTQQQKMVLLESIPKLMCLVHQLQSSDEAGICGKMAIYTLTLLSRVLGIEHHNTLSQLLGHMCDLMMEPGVSSDTAASAMMCAAEIVGNIQAHALMYMPRLVPFMLQQLHIEQGNDLLPCCITSLHKIIDALPHFMAPYLNDILTKVSHLQTKISEVPSGEQKDHVSKSVKHACKSMASLPSRVFLPTLDITYSTMLDSSRQEDIPTVLNVLSQHVSGMEREELHVHLQQLLAFFLVALDFRHTQRKVVETEVIENTEDAVIDAILTMVLKMTEATLRPMLLRIFEWATEEKKPNRVIVFYKLADRLAGKLQSLFVIFADNFMKYAAQLLDLLNSNKSEEKFLKKDKNGKKRCQLLKSVLGCIQQTCMFDTQNATNEWFSLLLEPLIDQVDNFVGSLESYEERIKGFLVPAVASFAVALKNDRLWKELNYSLLQKTKSKKKEVRISALLILSELHRKLGEDFINLLPETIPFISELMEDKNEEVENLTQKVLKEMEETFGESLHSFF